MFYWIIYIFLSYICGAVVMFILCIMCDWYRNGKPNTDLNIQHTTDKMESDNDLPEVYVDVNLLKPMISYTSKRNYKKPPRYYDKVYEINGSIFREDHTEAEHARIRSAFDVHAAGTKLLTIFESIDKHFPFSIKETVYGFLINSEVLLTADQWNTFVESGVAQKCLVCDTIIDETNTHMESGKHIRNLEKHQPLKKFYLSVTRLIKNVYHCGVCNECFGIAEEDGHFKSDCHLENMLFVTSRARDVMSEADTLDEHTDKGIPQTKDGSNYNLPEVFVDGNIPSDLLESSLYYDNVKETNSSIFREDVTRSRDDELMGFEIQTDGKLKLTILEAVVSDKHLRISIKETPYGLIINSNVLLTTYQWNTVVYCNNTQKCIVCDTTLSSFNDHVKSDVHMRNLEKYQPLKEFDLNITRLVKDKYHCGVCNESFDIDKDREHFASKSHEKNLLFAQNRMIDMMYDFDTHHDYARHNDKLTTERKQTLSESSYLISEDGISDSVLDDGFNTEYKMDENIESYAWVAKKTYAAPHYLDVTIFNKPVKMKFDHWHMIVSFRSHRQYCMACKKYLEKTQKGKHCLEDEHLTNLESFKFIWDYRDSYIRQISTNHFHCGICNNLQVISNINEHIRFEHKTKIVQAPEIVPSINKSDDNCTKDTNDNTNFVKDLKNVNENYAITTDTERDTHNERQTTINGSNDNLAHISTINSTNDIKTGNENKYNQFNTETNTNNDMKTDINDNNDDQINIESNTSNNTKTVINENNDEATIIQTNTNNDVKTDINDINIETSANNDIQINENENNALAIINDNEYKINNENPSISNDVLISKFGFTIRVSFISYNVVCRTQSDYHCYMCDRTACYNDMTCHIEEPCHVDKLRQIPFRNKYCVSLIRTVGSQNHCTICNIIFQLNETESHVIESNHVERLTKALITPHAINTVARGGYPMQMIQPTIYYQELIPVHNVYTVFTNQRPMNPPTLGIHQWPTLPPTRGFEPLLDSNRPANQLCTNQPATATKVNTVGTHLDQPPVSQPNSRTTSMTKLDTDWYEIFLNQRKTGLPILKIDQPKKETNQGATVQALNDENQHTVAKRKKDVKKPIADKNQRATDSYILDESDGKMESVVDMLDMDESTGNAEEDYEFFNEKFVYLKFKNTFIQVSLVSYNSLVNTGDGTRYCFVCMLRVYGSLKKHVESKNHAKCMDERKFVNKYDRHLLRQIFLTYHCGICNIIITRKYINQHIAWPLHDPDTKTDKKTRRTNIKAGGKIQNIAFQNEAMHLNGTEADINVLVRIEMKANTQIVEQIQKKNKIIIFGQKVMRISWDKYHGFSKHRGGHRCLLCACDVRSYELNVHIGSEFHRGLLDKFETRHLPQLVRKVNESTFNCVVCNVEVMNKEHIFTEHLCSKRHKKNYDGTVLESTPVDSYSDLNEDVLNLHSTRFKRRQLKK